MKHVDPIVSSIRAGALGVLQALDAETIDWDRVARHVLSQWSALGKRVAKQPEAVVPRS